MTTLRPTLLVLHAAAARAIAPGMDFDMWHARYLVPLVDLRIDAWLAVHRSANAATTAHHLAVRSEFVPREDALLARAYAAAADTAAARPKRRRRKALAYSHADAI